MNKYPDECKKCGLLRTTVISTKRNCLKGGAHDFGDHGISYPEKPESYSEIPNNSES